EAFVLPEGARTRMVQPGMNERLRVRVDPHEASIVQVLEQSPQLAIVGPTSTSAEVEVRKTEDCWVISNDVETQIATTSAGTPLKALRRGLESYAAYNLVLRLAKRCNDPQLARCLNVKLLEHSGFPAAAGSIPREIARDAQRLYRL